MNQTDFLRCGTCLSVFYNIAEFQEHKERCSEPNLEDVQKISEDGTQYVEVNVLPPPSTSQVTNSRNSEIPGGDLKCKLCQKTYKTAGTLKTHLKLHNDEKPYVCPHAQCGASFKIKSSLVRHNLRHLDLRPYTCDLCERTFRESGSLLRHKRSLRPCSEKLDTAIPLYGKRLPYSGEATKDSWQKPITVQVLENSDMQIISELSKPLVDLVTISSGMPEVNVHPSSTHESAAATEKDKSNPLITEDLDQTPIDMAKPYINEPYPMLNIVDITSAASEIKVSPYTTCLICTKSFEKKAELQSHLLQHIENNSFLCARCPYQAMSKKELKMHISHDHSLPKHAGRVVSDMMSISLSATVEPHYDILDNDAATSHEAENAVISVAETATSDKQISHQTSTNPNHYRAIREASRAVQQLLLLESDVPLHLRQVKNCPVCQKSFTANSCLQSHLRTHTGERPYRCKRCGKDFSTMDTFRKHVIIHGSERQYKCGECGKLFKRITHVKEHLKIHNHERPYDCSLCQKSFRTRNGWKVHQRTHSDYLPWQCKLCKKSFREKSGLLRHIRIHTGERPFVCKYCGKRFREHSTINRHLQAKVPCRIELAEARVQGIPLNYSAHYPNTLDDISNQARIAEEEFIIHTNNDEEIEIDVYIKQEVGAVYQGQMVEDDNEVQPAVALGHITGSDTCIETCSINTTVLEGIPDLEQTLQRVGDTDIPTVIPSNHRDEITGLDSCNVPAEVYGITEERGLHLGVGDQLQIL